jgi:hypothetical protein
MRSILALLFLSIAPLKLMAQAQPSQEIALDYTYIHTNAPPGGCGCFSMNGAGGSYAYHYGPQFALLVDFSVVHAAKVDPLCTLRPGAVRRCPRNGRSGTRKFQRRRLVRSFWLHSGRRR